MELLEVIKSYCKTWERLHNNGKLLHDVLTVQPDNSRYCSLFLNDVLLWFGTMQEVTAVIKTMCKLEEMKGM